MSTDAPRSETALPTSSVPFIPPPDVVAAAVGDRRRLSILRRTGLLDTPAEPSFERVTKIAFKMLGVTAAVVSLIDEDRQFIQAGTGLGEPLATTRQTPVSRSFCQFIVATGEPLAVTDTRDHLVLSSHEAVTEFGVVAYAGVPLKVAGVTLGALCVFQTTPRAWSEDELELIRELALSVGREIELRLALGTIAESEARYRVMFDALGAGVVVVDEQRRITWVNEAATNLVGYDTNELVGRNLVEFFSPDDVASGHVARVFAGSLDRVVEVLRVRHRDGRWLWFRGTVTSMSEGSDQPARVVCVFDDVTEPMRLRAELERRERLYRTLSQNLPNGGVVLFDRDYRYLLADGEALFRAAGLTKEDFEGRTIDQVHSTKDNVEKFAVLYGETLAGKPGSGEFQRLGRWYEVNTAPILAEDGTVESGMAMMYDITARKEVELELRETLGWMRLLKRVAARSNEARTAKDAFVDVLELLCTELGFVVGHVYTVDGGAPQSSRSMPPPSASTTRGIPRAKSSNVFRTASERWAPFVAVTEGMTFDLGVGLPGQVLQSRKAVWMDDIHVNSEFLRREAAERVGLSCALAIPIWIGDDIVGVIELFAERREPPNYHALEITDHVGIQLGRVIERERAAARVEALSLTDDLTGLANRRAFAMFAERQREVSMRDGVGFTVMFADLDGLKAINDQIGHAAGDDAICILARVLRQTVRTSDLVARLGGDEFVALLVGDLASSVASVEARVRAALLQANAAWPHPTHPLSISIGFTAFAPSEPQTIDALLESADASMYEQKRAKKVGRAA